MPIAWLMGRMGASEERGGGTDWQLANNPTATNSISRLGLKTRLGKDIEKENGYERYQAVLSTSPYSLVF